ncbi:MAG TPA: glycosyltransferase family 9 protein [Thermoanaerobaculia bacterium]|nr:glycosyltransferase family 9 protein [Thermoanaerobaculia bacterium]
MKELARAARRALRLPGRWALEGLAAGVARARRDGAAPPADPRSIFVLRNNDLGDLLVVTPLFEALRRRFPDARIAAGVGSWSLELLRGNPHLSEVLTVDAPWFNKYAARGALGRLRWLSRSPQAAELARRGFEVGIDVLGSAWGSLLLLRAGIPWRMGVEGYAGGHRAVQRTVRFRPGEHVGRSALRFAELLGATELPPARPQLFLSPEEQAAGERLWGGASPRGVRLAVGPGGGLPDKCWPPESFAALLRQLADVPGLEIAIVGGPRERKLAAELAVACPGARVFPDLGLRETFALIAAADGVICNSSLLLHVAAAFSRPTLALLGPAFPSARGHQAQWGYPGTCWSLGREGGARGIATPEEAARAVREHLLGRAA